MKHSRIILFTTLIAGLLISCSSNDRASYGGNTSTSDAEAFDAASPPPPSAEAGGYVSEESDKDVADRASNMMQADSLMSNMSGDIPSMMSSSAAKGSPLADTSQKFIRTADVKFRVKNVRTATFGIEKITAHFNGYVAHTGLESVVSNETRTKVSDDSTLITTYFTVSNNFVLRVPAENLDSTLRTMGMLAEYLDYRRIHVENATLMILRERLAARRINRSTERLENAVDETNAKLRDRASIEEAIYNKQTMADETLIRTLELKDQIQLSTISLQIYQRQAWIHEMVANEKNIDAYKPGFGHQLGESLRFGLELLKGLILVVVGAWPLLLFMVLVIVVVMVLRRRKSA